MSDNSYSKYFYNDVVRLFYVFWMVYYFILYHFLFDYFIHSLTDISRKKPNPSDNAMGILCLPCKNVLLYYFILLFIYFMIFFNHLLTFPPKSQTPQITLWEFNACHVKYIIPITICMFYYCYYF